VVIVGLPASQDRSDDFSAQSVARDHLLQNDLDIFQSGAGSRKSEQMTIAGSCRKAHLENTGLL